jgi:hypothetical protein
MKRKNGSSAQNARQLAEMGEMKANGELGIVLNNRMW